MAKFRNGDTVRRNGENFGNVTKGGIYVVRLVSPDGTIHLDGDYVYGYEEAEFDLVKAFPEHPTLTLEGAAIALAKGEKIDYWHCGEWLPLLNLDAPWLDIRGLLQSAKLRRHVPATMVVNGVTVPQPIKNIKEYKARNSFDKLVYTIDFSGHSRSKTVVQAVDVLNLDKLGLYWETKQDALEVAKAIEKPFSELT